jgi:hypothetical protein
MDLLNNENSGNGLITKIWGPSTWITFHSFAFGYPMNPNDDHKKEYKLFYQTFAKVLPCSYCRTSYQEFITSGKTLLSDDVFNNRATLTYWTYLLHEAVNKKLGVDYCVTYEDMVKRYESYRAKCDKSLENEKAKGCVMPLRQKMKPFSVLDHKECPIIPKSLALKFKDYAQTRGLIDDDFKYINLKLDSMDKMEDLVIERDKYCEDIILNMRINGIPSLELIGEYQGLPTIDELKLIMARCSLISKEELEKINPNKKIEINYKPKLRTVYSFT